MTSTKKLTPLGGPHSVISACLHARNFWLLLNVDQWFGYCFSAFQSALQLSYECILSKLTNYRLRKKSNGHFSLLVPGHKNATLTQCSLDSSWDGLTSFSLQPSFTRDPPVHSLFPYILFLSSLCPAFCILTFVKSCLQEAFCHSLMSVIPCCMFLFASITPYFLVFFSVVQTSCIKFLWRIHLIRHPLNFGLLHGHTFSFSSTHSTYSC